jgi:hypothetical protein
MAGSQQVVADGRAWLVSPLFAGTDGTKSFVCWDELRPMTVSPLECGTRGEGYPMGSPDSGNLAQGGLFSLPLASRSTSESKPRRFAQPRLRISLAICVVPAWQRVEEHAGA